MPAILLACFSHAACLPVGHPFFLLICQSVVYTLAVSMSVFKVVQLVCLHVIMPVCLSAYYPACQSPRWSVKFFVSKQNISISSPIFNKSEDFVSVVDLDSERIRIGSDPNLDRVGLINGYGYIEQKLPIYFSYCTVYHYYGVVNV
jgi:hypothetical protein